MAKKNRPAPASPKTLGPVSDLERHLPPEWWRTLFNSVYLRTDGDVVENVHNTRREVDLLIDEAGLEPNDRVLDLCCGQGRHCMELARRGFRHVTGVDRSRYLIRLARKRALEAGYAISFHQGDARKFRLPESTFHCVAIMGNSFGYFDREEDDLAVLQSAWRVLSPGGTIALDVVDGEWMRNHFEARSWEWLDQNQFVCRERSLASDGKRLVSREVVVHAERGVIVDQFYAERLYSREDLLDLLERSGFESIRSHGAIEAASDRNQDLGFMANRMFITAEAVKRVTPKKKGAVRFPRITVLMGDPSLPDSVKRNGVFNPEDIETINRLKRGLAELEDYSYEFEDNHGSWMTKLRQDRPEFVLNLCDEGYNNDAFMELHVPAFLEMLGVPYTGAGPGCLALCYNKSLVCSIAASLEIPVPLETVFNPDDQSATLPSTFPALVKPNYGDSSIGITKDAVVFSPEDLMAYLRSLQETLPGRPILIQEFLSGTEYSIGMIGNPSVNYRYLAPLEVDYSKLPPDLPQILGYESKWYPDSPYWNDIAYREAELDEETLRRLQDHSAVLFERLGCRDYARFDWRADAQGEIKLMEVNPNPGWCWDGKLNLMAGMSGMRYSDLLGQIIEAAQERVAATMTREKNGKHEKNGIQLVGAPTNGRH